MKIHDPNTRHEKCLYGSQVIKSGRPKNEQLWNCKKWIFQIFKTERSFLLHE